MFKPSIALLFFVASSLSYSKELDLNTIKEPTIGNSIKKQAPDEITPLEYVGFMVYAGSFVMLSKSKDLLEHSYARMRLEKPTFHHKKPHIMRKCSLLGIGIGGLIILSRDIAAYLKR